MLVLQRMPDQSVVITVPPSDREQRVVCTVARVRGNAVRLGFTAHPDVYIHREEIQAEIDAKAAEGGRP